MNAARKSSLVFLILPVLLLSSCGDSIKWPWAKQQSADEEAAQIHREKLIKEAQNGKVSEVGQAAVTAIQKQEEQKLVERAGEAAVIIELARKQYAELKERLVRIKTLKAGFERDLQETEQKGSEAKLAGTEEIAKMYTQKADSRKNLIKLVNEREPAALKALEEYAVTYEKLKIEVELIQDEAAVHNASMGILNPSAPTNSLKDRLDRISELKSSLTKQADRAKSLFEVTSLEEKFKL
jgi:hypothetical protein